MPQGLVGHHRVSLHHVLGHFHVAGIGGVGHHIASKPRRVLGGLADGIVVVAGGAHHLCAVLLDRPLAAFADGRMDIDHALAAKALRAPGHRTAMIAVGRAGHRHGLRQFPVTAGQQIVDRQVVAPQPGRELAQQLAADRVGPAQRLEAAQPEAAAFVLVADGRHAGLARQTGQVAQRRGLIAGPAADLRLGKRIGLAAKHVELPLPIRRGRFESGIRRVLQPDVRNRVVQASLLWKFSDASRRNVHAVVRCSAGVHARRARACAPGPSTDG
ncbi:hypothetical protein D3C71_1462390 [compost metagenome]